MSFPMIYYSQCISFAIVPLRGVSHARVSLMRSISEPFPQRQTKYCSSPLKEDLGLHGIHLYPLGRLQKVKINHFKAYYYIWDHFQFHHPTIWGLRIQGGVSWRKVVFDRPRSFSAKAPLNFKVQYLLDYSRYPTSVFSIMKPRVSAYDRIWVENILFSFKGELQY